MTGEGFSRNVPWLAITLGHVTPGLFGSAGASPLQPAAGFAPIPDRQYPWHIPSPLPRLGAPAVRYGIFRPAHLSGQAAAPADTDEAQTDKNMDLKVESSKNEEGVRIYRIK